MLDSSNECVVYRLNKQFNSAAPAGGGVALCMSIFLFIIMRHMFCSLRSFNKHWLHSNSMNRDMLFFSE